MTNAVQTQGLTKKYKTTTAVKNVDIQVPQGCCCGFLGKNGAGKTTTIKMLVGLIRPTAGKIQMMGSEQHFGRQNAAVFGYLPDVPNFYSYMNGEEFLALCAKICKIPTGEAKQRIKSLLQLVGLDKTRTKIAGYSRGMKQRLGIAQAMINSPQVIFMDEPMSALDPMGRRDVAEIIQSLKGTTVIFSTHILADVENVCDYILIIEKGKIVAQDNMENLRRRHSQNTAKIRFYQESDAKLFQAKAKEANLAIDTLDAPQELLINAPDGQMENLSRAATGIIHVNNLAVESFSAHTPSLEDIFYREISNEKRNNAGGTL
ncbi:MAG: ABC transporter ATP-binding protein [Firmicutes bacterium]|nr:ABC transporter ATP-binding protein [Bacillota bacterium]